MGILRGSLIFFISFILIISISLFLVSAGVSSLLYPNIYIQTFEKNNLYDYLENKTSENFAPGADFLMIENPREEFSRLLTNFLSYLRGKTSTPNLIVKINQTALHEFFEDETENYKICRLGEEPFDGDEVRCRPANKNPSEFLDEVLERKNLNFFENDTVDLAYVYDKDGDFSTLKKTAGYFRIGFYSLLVFSLFLIGLIFLLKFTNYISAIKIAGINVAIAGLVIFLPMLFSSYIYENYFPAFTKQEFSIPIFADMVKDLFFAVINKIYIYSIIAIVLGILLITVSAILKVRSWVPKKKDEEKESNKKEKEKK